MKSQFKSLALIALLIVGTYSCNTKKQDTENQESIEKTETAPVVKQEEKHWSYEGETSPEHWAEIEKNSSCNGKSQSPINIVTDNTVVDNDLKPIDIQYSANTKIHDVTNNGHTIQYNFEPGDYVNYHNEKFTLKQIHFHETAEHTIDGVRYPIVIHMVHISDKGEILVLGIMAKEGKASETFNFLESYLPISVKETKVIDKPFNLVLNFPKNKGYYTYSGSLTTPPCTEGVNWVIFKDPITVSLAQVEGFRNLMPHNNYRNEQPLNGRVVKATKF